MKKAYWLVVLILALLVFSIPVSADGYDILVVGQNDETVDAFNVQAAIDAASPGDTILLRGTFDFGMTTGALGAGYSVNINKDINIIGEKDTDGTHLTKIVGGFTPFRAAVDWYDWGFGPLWVVNGDSPHHIVVRDIYFENPYASAIWFSKFNGLEITGCKFVDVRPLDSRLYLGVAFGIQIWVGTFQLFDAYVDPINASGEVIIRDNYFDGGLRSTTTDPWALPLYTWPPIYGVGAKASIMPYTTNARIIIEENIFYDANGGIEAIENYDYPIIVRNNHFEQLTTEDIQMQSMSYLASAYGLFDPSGTIGPLYYINNTHHTPWGVGLLSQGNDDHNMNMPGSIIKDNSFVGIEYFGIELGGIKDTIIINNEIHLDGENAYGIGLGGAWPTDGSSNNFIGQNKISGNGLIGMKFWTGLPGATVAGNVIQGNNLSLLNAEVDYYFFEQTENNTVIGSHGTVVDLGVNNYVTGLTPGSGVGIDVSEAILLKNEILFNPFPPLITP